MFKNQIIRLLIVVFTILFLTITLCRAASSGKNRQIAEENYPDSWLERFVATHFGDELPSMRDDLITRKRNGENILVRHWYAWTTMENWEWHQNEGQK